MNVLASASWSAGGASCHHFEQRRGHRAHTKSCISVAEVQVLIDWSVHFARTSKCPDARIPSTGPSPTFSLGLISTKRGSSEPRLGRFSGVGFAHRGRRRAFFLMNGGVRGFEHSLVTSANDRV